MSSAWFRGLVSVSLAWRNHPQHLPTRRREGEVKLTRRLEERGLIPLRLGLVLMP